MSVRDELEAARKAHRLFGSGPFNRDAELARIILHEDMGWRREHEPQDYGDDPATILRLAAHARQDAAHAVLSTHRLLQQVKWLRRMVFLSLCLLAAMALKLLA